MYTVKYNGISILLICQSQQYYKATMANHSNDSQVIAKNINFTTFQRKITKNRQ